MINAKLLAILAAMVAVLAVSAAPASAIFVSNTGETHGAGKSGAMTLEGGGATLECSSAEGEWKIQTAGKIEEHEKGEKQQPALEGPQLYLLIKKWIGCKAKSSLIKEAKPTVKECTLHLEQVAKGETKAKGAVATECTVEVKVLGTCTIKVPAAKESEKLNFGLEKNTLENSGTNLLTTAEDSGITTKPSAACLGIKETKEGKMKSTVGGIVGEGLKEA
jgi:hypothetical protein